MTRRSGTRTRSPRRCQRTSSARTRSPATSSWRSRSAAAPRSARPSASGAAASASTRALSTSSAYAATWRRSASARDWRWRLLMDIWNDPECKEMVLDFVRWSKEDLVEGVFQLRGSDGSVVAEYADLSDVPLRFTDPTSGAERAVHLDDVGVVWRLGRERWRDAAVDGELPDEFVQVLAKLLHWTERGMVRTNVQVRAPSGALVTSF